MAAMPTTLLTGVRGHVGVEGDGEGGRLQPHTPAKASLQLQHHTPAKSSLQLRYHSRSQTKKMDVDKKKILYESVNQKSGARKKYDK